ncbi:MAG: hypothetical protein CMF46_02655 [Legionellales bacterium]|nr:hypothetical protein [Legionellales bacterium]
MKAIRTLTPLLLLTNIWAFTGTTTLNINNPTDDMWVGEFCMKNTLGVFQCTSFTLDSNSRKTASLTLEKSETKRDMATVDLENIYKIKGWRSTNDLSFPGIQHIKNISCDVVRYKYALDCKIS